MPAALGDFEGRLSAMLPALAEHREVVGSLVTDIMLGLIAAAYAQAGRWDEGLARIDEGLEQSAAIREHVYAAELWRLKGELLLGKVRADRRKKGSATHSMVDAAQQCFHRALNIAREQEARSIELWTVMDLARLSSRRDESTCARSLLRSLVASFTEGFDTKDLKEAAALLHS